MYTDSTHRIIKRNQYPESSLWETSEGQEWLRLLVLASIFIFALGASRRLASRRRRRSAHTRCEELAASEFPRSFIYLRLQHHIGVSPTALRSLRARMESVIIEYQQRQKRTYWPKSRLMWKFVWRQTETFFEGVILVMLDLPSGYIFVEEITKDCQYETWQQRVSQIFQPLGSKGFKYLVSDRAKAIIKLALNDLGTNSISDLFHVLYDLNRSIGFELNRLGSRLEKQISRAKLNQSKPEIIKELELKKLILQKSKVSYNHCCYSISTCLHPFDINHNTVQTTELVKQSLENIQGTLQNIYTNHRLQDPRSGIRKLKTSNSIFIGNH